MAIDINAQVHRYGHPLPHQSLVTRRDLHAEKVNAHLGQTAAGVTLTDEQVEQRRTGRGPSTGLPYRHLVSGPGSFATPWAAFYTDEQLATWAGAYGMALSGSLEPGGRFALQLPDVKVGAFAVVATDRREVLSDVFDTVDEAEAAMLGLYPVVSGTSWRQVPVAVADLAGPDPYWRTVARELASV